MPWTYSRNPALNQVVGELSAKPGGLKAPLSLRENPIRLACGLLRSGIPSAGAAGSARGK